MRRRLAGKRVVITGALGGIGRAAVIALRAEGAIVYGIDLSPAEDVDAADVADREAITAAIERASDRLGGIDILINNAGIGRAHDAGDFPDEEARAVMNVNFFGAWNATAAAMPFLLDSGGHVVNVSSGLALVDLPYASAYSASKRSLDAYSTALRIEYRGRLTVTSLHPGFIQTDIHAVAARDGATLEGMVRPDSVDQAAAAIVRACVKRPRTAATSVLTSIELWSAQRFRRSTELVLARRFERWKSSRSQPLFLRFPTRNS